MEIELETCIIEREPSLDRAWSQHWRNTRISATFFHKLHRPFYSREQGVRLRIAIQIEAKPSHETPLEHDENDATNTIVYPVMETLHQLIDMVEDLAEVRTFPEHMSGFDIEETYLGPFHV